MNRLNRDHPLNQALRDLLPGDFPWPRAEVLLEPLPSSRQVARLTTGNGEVAVVGKFFCAYPPATDKDRSLDGEYGNYLRAEVLGLTQGAGLIPRLLGRSPQARLGLVVEAVSGPDLDQALALACRRGENDQLFCRLEKLAGLLAVFHTRPLPEQPVSPQPALDYLAKLRRQLRGLSLLTAEDEQVLQEEAAAWAGRLARFPDHLVLAHGDATPTNFLFPDGRVVALDLERLRYADRLWDLSWVAGEMKHAWGWRTGHPEGAESAIGHFFASYLRALPADAALTRRIFTLNPFYMALAELRIARNDYLSRHYRLALVAEARRCLAGGRSLSL
ncbi:MAG: hypothetical protein C4567_18345 [Deltaproteobacteria bacterium]|nr:MAG: hypothetical protein C4567_18345 [Deltaproteobacteria bacterium]